MTATVADECRRCSTSGQPVPRSLVRHHVTKAWQKDLDRDDLNFCDTPGCEVVYFGSEGVMFTVADVRRAPAYKTGAGTDLLCFCFDVTGDDTLRAANSTPYIRERVRKSECACDILNPSGTCCLGSIGRWAKTHGQP